MIWVTVILAIIDMIWQWWLANHKALPPFMQAMFLHAADLATEWIKCHPNPTTGEKRRIRHVLAELAEKQAALSMCSVVTVKSAADLMALMQSKCGDAQLDTRWRATFGEISNA
jgi:hypothetical protein